MVAIISDIGGQMSNSYASQKEAIDYFNQRLYADAFLTASAENQSKSLIMATALLETLVKWHGSRLTDTQRLSFPRINNCDEKNNQAIIPQNIKAAEFELAIYLLQQNSIQDTATLGISELEVGPIKLSIDPDRKKNVFPDIVYELVAGYGIATRRDRSTGSYSVALERS